MRPIPSSPAVKCSFPGYDLRGGVFDISQNPPAKVWENKNMRNHMASSVLWQGHLYGGDENQLRCVVFDTGEVKWTDKVTGKGSLILADGKLIVLTERGELIVANPAPEGFKADFPRTSGRWEMLVRTHASERQDLRFRTGPGDVACLDVSGK